MSKFKVIRVFVNNEPDQYHVTKGGFGKFIEPLCITHSRENALLILKCVNCFDSLRIGTDAAISLIRHLMENDEPFEEIELEHAIEVLDRAQTEVEEHERENHE